MLFGGGVVVSRESSVHSTDDISILYVRDRDGQQWGRGPRSFREWIEEGWMRDEKMKELHSGGETRHVVS